MPRPPAIRVEVVSTTGSAPRDAGAWMIVTETGIAGAIGGGALEWAAVKAAREMLAAGEEAREMDQPLGPDLGQCCGGRVRLTLRRAESEAPLPARDGPPVLIFGAGHVGGALARALAPLPFAVTVIDQRSEWLAPLERSARTILSALPEAEVAAAPPGAGFVILTHDHALDFLIAEAALARRDAAYVGMIGSKTKRVRLVADLSRKQAPGAERLVCPIGAGGPRDKRPAVIAAATAAELCAALL